MTADFVLGSPTAVSAVVGDGPDPLLDELLESCLAPPQPYPATGPACRERTVTRPSNTERRRFLQWSYRSLPNTTKGGPRVVGTIDLRLFVRPFDCYLTVAPSIMTSPGPSSSDR